MKTVIYDGYWKHSNPEDGDALKLYPLISEQKEVIGCQILNFLKFSEKYKDDAQEEIFEAGTIKLPN